MDTTATQPMAGEAPAPSRRKWAQIGLFVFIVYVAMLYVLAFDQWFDWGLFPPKLDRELSAKISQLGDTSLKPEQMLELKEDIIGWNTFSVPLLIKAVEKNAPGVREPATQCLQVISMKFYNEDITPLGSDPAKLKDWWKGMQEKFEKAEKAAAQ